MLTVPEVTVNVPPLLEPTLKREPPLLQLLPTIKTPLPATVTPPLPAQRPVDERLPDETLSVPPPVLKVIVRAVVLLLPVKSKVPPAKFSPPLVPMLLAPLSAIALTLSVPDVIVVPPV